MQEISLLVIPFLNELELICLYTSIAIFFHSWIVVIIVIYHNSIQYQPFVFIQWSDYKYCYEH